ncbi:phospholipase A1-like [Aricia agestis]|uniref:phospholipase A1-like n=1 Tax=Aricia agestis TaxID=91739 RepID=UPI001C20A99A|nr:phospholipase A1-like [Aricia agestis]
MKQFLFSHVCLLLLLKFHYAYTASLRLYCGNVNNYTSTPLENPLPLLSNTCFNKNLKSMIYAFGYTAGPESKITLAILRSYLKIHFNVFLVDWEKESASYPPYLPEAITYTFYAAPNTKKVGKTCGQALNTLAESALDLTTTHVIGHSLGAHMMGFCGQELQKYKKIMTRLTGLDPAGPVFDYSFTSGIGPSSAKFVDVIHTNPGGEGTVRNLGTVDIRFNCDKPYQPQCANETSILDKVSCSHQSACFYFAEAVLNGTAFAAERSRSCLQWQRLTSTPEISNIIYVGETTDTSARGTYYLRTRDRPPYGIGAEGLRAT